LHQFHQSGLVDDIDPLLARQILGLLCATAQRYKHSFVRVLDCLRSQKLADVPDSDGPLSPVLTLHDDASAILLGDQVDSAVGFGPSDSTHSTTGDLVDGTHNHFELKPVDCPEFLLKAWLALRFDGWRHGWRFRFAYTPRGSRSILKRVQIDKRLCRFDTGLSDWWSEFRPFTFIANNVLNDEKQHDRRSANYENDAHKSY
jgi:hypothetical protein